MRKLLLATALACATMTAAQADEWVVEAHYPDRATMLRATSKFQHVKVDAERQVLRLDTDDAGIEALQRAGLTVRVDVAGTAELRGFLERIREAMRSNLPAVNPNGYPSIPGYSCYRTVEGAYQTMDDLVAAEPGLAEVHEIGPSWEKTQNPANGYTMRALRVTNLATAASDPERPVFAAFGSIHAREYTPAELLTRMAEWLITGYGVDPEASWLVDHVDFRLILMANPDGRKKAEAGESWRKNTNSIDGYCGYWWGDSGIDLNRNFPFHWHTTGEEGSSSDPCDETFRGLSAGSEPETQNLVTYVAGAPSGGVYAGGVLPDRRPDDLTTPAPDDYAGLFFDIHSYSQLVLWSWGDTYSAAPNDPALRTLGRRMAWFNGYTPQAAVELYPTDGTTDDTFYGVLGAPSYTIELGTSFFESCGSFESATFPKNFDALRYTARAASAPYRLPAGPDTYDLSASAAQQGGGGWYVSLEANVSDSRYNQSNGSQTTYNISGANAYIDRLPWEAGAAPIALTASDGSFDAKTEAVEGNLSLAGLTPGRHIVYVQGVNVRNGGTPGTPNAVFIEVPPSGVQVVVSTAVAGAGSIDPPGPVTADAGTTLSFSILPDLGHHVAQVDGCGGSYAEPIWTTAPLSADCTVSASFAPDQHTIGGTLSGLTGAGLRLELNHLLQLNVPAHASDFQFPGGLDWGSSYAVTIAQQPNCLLCSVSRGSGVVSGDVTDVEVDCAPDPGDLIFRDDFETP